MDLEELPNVMSVNFNKGIATFELVDGTLIGLNFNDIEFLKEQVSLYRDKPMID